MKLAAIDIGSNAIRLQVTRTVKSKTQLRFKKLEYVRFPLRLGKDVFISGEISEEGQTKFKKLMKAFKLLIDLYEVDDYMACATSAMREAKNGKQLAKIVKKEIGLKIQIIDGAEEAAMINNAILSFLDVSKNYLHIDVGGGSTELNILHNGKKVSSRSFKIGSVRRLEHHDSPEIWHSMEEWVKKESKEYASGIVAVGTGGNINKLNDLADLEADENLPLKRIKELQSMLRSLSIQERINELDLNPDRADVIVPASEIYVAVMECAGASNIIVPDVGLKDGMMRHLFDRNEYRQ